MAPPSDTNTNTSATAVAVFLDSTFPSNRHVFLRPSPLLPAGSLQIAKDTLDVLAGQVADQQQQRLREAGGKKRKRDGTTDKTAPLKIRKVHVDGFETGQVWQQARKIITSALAESEQILAELEANDEVVNGVEAKEEGDAMVNGDGEEGSDVSEEEEESASGDEFEEFSDEEAEVDAGDDNLSEADLDEEEEEGEEDEDVESGSEEGEEDGYDDEPEDEYVEDPFGLNDGFFSIDEFNKQTQWFEDQDARGDPNTDVLSEDESIDWHADPFAPKKPKKKANGDDADESEEESDEEDDDEGGAGLSKEDLANQLDAESDDEEEGNLDDEIADMGLDLTANDIYYKDFFAPPKKKKKPGNKPKRQEPARPFRPDDADIERAENDVRRDLFEDLSERSDEEDALSDVSAGDPKSRRSAHERRQAKIAEEIRRLEAELVAKRAWTLSGEAKAADRPVNSLLEEDLDFEHVGKPVPVITEDVSESIEELIKRRILANEFDEVLRRRPDAFGNPNGARRGLVDVDDTKAKQSLAEIYEEEHVKKANPDAYVSAADEKLRRDEEEIKRMWKEISAKLDALSSWHYKPKPAAPTLTVVSDVATVAMEDAQPTTAQGVAAGESMIAPQEVYAPSKATAEKGEVVAKSGLPVAKEEMTREEKLRRRRREKERIRKAGGLNGKAESKKEQEKRETMNNLKKGGVKVINRKGEVVGLDGKKVVEGKGVQSGGAFKL
ncbi:hypothetical protein VTJ49DRAFT_962 [Mycothermus thermophilus]|uniref:U3 small nucleolar ribonucleoprotein protein MPP10 n=1 Tax=Humicola insolens TaxID=85995 RepID=A0ABR3VEL5_HUMIN